MRHKNVEVTPYSHTYRLFHKPTGETYGDFECLGDAVLEARNKPKKHHRQQPISFTRKLEPEGSYTNYLGWYRGFNVPRPYEVVHYPAPEWLILNDLGDVVTENEVKGAFRGTYRNRWSEDRDRRYLLNGSRRVRIKGSGAKVKLVFSKVYTPAYESHGREIDAGYDWAVPGYARVIRTQQERRVSAGHMDEYGRQMVRGRRRPFQLPDSWHDYPPSIYKTGDSWKHHSKRRKQWIPD